MNAFHRKIQNERDDINSALEDFPHSFKMKDIGHVRRNAFESLKNHLQAALESGYSTDLETARTSNLLAFALFRLGEHSEALELTGQVLAMKGQERNIVSLANKASMLCQTSEFEEALEVVKELNELKEGYDDFDYLKVKAQGELAGSYMRFGPRFNTHAAEAFNDVIKHAREPEVWMWKFGLAVTHRHALDLQYAPYASERQDTVTHRDAMRLLQEVIDSKPRSEEDKALNNNLKANAHAEMALLLRSTVDDRMKIELGFEAHTGPMASCKKALALDDNDPSVLWKTGKIYRNYKDLFKSRKLLEKAVTLQRSSAAYHHLGLTYKAMATNFKYGKLKTRRGGRRAKERKRSKEEKLQRQRAEEGGAAPQQHSRENSGVPAKRGKREKDAVDRMRKMVKSPKDTTEFDPEDRNVLLAIENLKEAVSFSKGENSRAVYDLALMYKVTNNYTEALKLFKDIQKRENQDIHTPSGVLERITAREQMGLIYNEMAKKEEDLQKKAKLKKESDSMFNRALSTAAELFSTTAAVRNIFGKIFHSPSALLRAADATNTSKGEKLKTQAEIFKLLNNHQKTQALLGEIAMEEHDERFYKLKIESDLKGRDPEKAAACLALLKPTGMYEKVRKLFKKQRDVHMLHDVYYEAGRKALLEGADPISYFSSAFTEVAEPPPLASLACSEESVQTSVKQIDDSAMGACSSPQGAQRASDGKACSPGDDPYFDVMLLHDEEDDDIEMKAIQLHEFLRSTLRLKVVRRDENCLLGREVLKSVMDNMERSRLILVLPGKENKMEPFETFVRQAAQRSSTVVLLTDGVTEERIPRELKANRTMHCPSELFASDVNPQGPHTDVTINALCRFFRFLGETDH